MLKHKCHQYRPHNNQIMAILGLFNLESDKVIFSTVPAKNASEHILHILGQENAIFLGDSCYHSLTQL